MGWIPEPWWRIRHRRKRTSGDGARLRYLSLRHRCAQSRALLLPLFSRLSQVMVEAGLPPKVLVAKIDRSPGNFDTAPDVLKQLKAVGVDDSVILAMVRA